MPWRTQRDFNDVPHGDGTFYECSRLCRKHRLCHVCPYVLFIIRSVFAPAHDLKATAPTRRVAPGENKKKRRKSKAAAAMLALLILWYAHTQVSASLALLITVILVPSLAAFFVLRRRRRSRAKRVLFEMGVRDLDHMDGISFEKFLESLFARLGYESEATQASGDYGVDVLIRKKGRRIAVQAKHYSSPVGIGAVQEVHAGVKHYEADEGWVITNSSFTRAAHELAASTGVRLMDGEALREVIASASRKHGRPGAAPPPPHHKAAG